MMKRLLTLYLPFGLLGAGVNLVTVHMGWSLLARCLATFLVSAAGTWIYLRLMDRWVKWRARRDSNSD